MWLLLQTRSLKILSKTLDNLKGPWISWDVSPSHLQGALLTFSFRTYPSLLLKSGGVTSQLPCKSPASVCALFCTFFFCCFIITVSPGLGAHYLPVPTVPILTICLPCIKTLSFTYNLVCSHWHVPGLSYVSSMAVRRNLLILSWSLKCFVKQD